MTGNTPVQYSWFLLYTLTTNYELDFVIGCEQINHASITHLQPCQCSLKHTKHTNVTIHNQRYNR